MGSWSGRTKVPDGAAPASCPEELTESGRPRDAFFMPSLTLMTHRSLSLQGIESIS